MPEPIAYLNGRFLPAAQLAVPVHDAGFVQGAAVAEQVRTFAGRLFRLPQHLERLARSLAIVGIAPQHGPDELAQAAERVAAENHRLLAAGDDLGLSIFVTPGPYASLAPRGVAGPTVAMHSYPLPFRLFARKYREGETARIVGVRQVPSECWPAELKCRSRMHYYLADREARLAEPGARAILLDGEGAVSEASTANVVAYFANEGLVSPPREKILAGISIGVLAELADAESIPLGYRDLRPEELARADEVFLCSTSPCLVPVVRLDGRPVGSGSPGPAFAKLLAAWSRLVGVGIAEQAERFASR
jgi:branched-chain amino acid aminotransferase